MRSHTMRVATVRYKIFCVCVVKWQSQFSKSFLYVSVALFESSPQSVCIFNSSMHIHVFGRRQHSWNDPIQPNKSHNWLISYSSTEVNVNRIACRVRNIFIWIYYIRHQYLSNMCINLKQKYKFSNSRILVVQKIRTTDESLKFKVFIWHIAKLS